MAKLLTTTDMMTTTINVSDKSNIRIGTMTMTHQYQLILCHMTTLARHTAHTRRPILDLDTIGGEPGTYRRALVF